MFVSDELKNALKASQERHPEVSFDNSLVRLFIGKVTELKEGREFGEALRYSLNACQIWDKRIRTAYSSLAGTYFGKHKGRKTVRRKTKHKRLHRDPKKNVTKICINNNGQYEFDI
ncbi:hypothetical protein MNBD_BACTEROID05-91 [hydrothermal vent metagenome]|uniref:Uncharacterized protein n=1 Tax=hydrothermal vent metagenome TaxID=652676 RepID=A0A3B0U210_9ZZZZ